MSLVDTARAVIERHGEAVTVRSDVVGAGANSWTSGAVVSVFYAGRGRAAHYEPNQIAGGIEQHDVLFSLDPAGFPVLPKKGDKIARGSYSSDAGADWLRVVNVEVQRVQGRAAVLRVQARK